MKEYILLDQLIVKLMALLGASLLIERLLTFLNMAMNRLFIFKYSNRFILSEKTKLRIDRDMEAAKEDMALKEADEEVTEDNNPGEVAFNPAIEEKRKVISGFDILYLRPVKEILEDEKRYETYKENNVIMKEFWMQILGSLIAITFCISMKFSIWEFFSYSLTGTWPASHFMWEYVFTGIIIGSGSKPINFLMNFLVNRKIHVDIQEVQEEIKETPGSEIVEKTKVTAPVPAIQPVTLALQPVFIEELVGFEYDGGDRPQRLENVHKYTGDIDLIVYHHTTQHSDAPFAEVVKEFDRKGWLTGYHCVVFQDGTIRVLCRWDRVGNHASPHNFHSFGIAFQGNFEPNPNIPSSNVDGKLGILTPKPAQLQAAARVTAMYALLHDMKTLKFHTSKITSGKPAGIIPHKYIAAKACPGSNFPKSQFEDLIGQYHAKWKADASFKEALGRFKEKPMVYPKNS